MIEYKFYIVRNGCMGHIGHGRYMLFATENEYTEWYSLLIRKTEIFDKSTIDKNITIVEDKDSIEHSDDDFSK